jgi:hypothetical protein
MREDADAAKVRRLMDELGRRARGPGRVYFTGGATAVLIGWRTSTIDVDLKLDPEPAGVFEAIAQLKDELAINVELAAPDQFIPPLPGWREHSRFIGKHGPIEFFHYDLRAQALSKIERGHAKDVDDVRAMISSRLVDPTELRVAFDAIEPELVRYPALDADLFRQKLEEALEPR